MDSVNREIGIMFLAGKSFFLHRPDYLSVLKQTSCAIMVKTGNPEDIHSFQVNIEIYISCAIIKEPLIFA